MSDRSVISTSKSSARVPALVARVLLATVGAITLAGGIYFTFFASPEEGGVSTGADWAVAVWSLTMSIAYLLAALILNPVRPATVRFGITVAAVHILFGLVKFIGYQEYEAAPFFVADIAIIATLLLVSRRSAR